MATGPLTFGSVFSGYGGLDLGLERAGLKCKWQVEKEPDARRVLAAEWPHVWRFCDAREFPPSEVRVSGDVDGRAAGRHVGRDVGSVLAVDLIAGGDPCQENSGLRVAAGVSQASLGGEFLRIVGAIRPPLVLRENPTRVRPDAPWPWWRFRDGLLDLGYRVLPFRLRACCLGLDHQRDRMFLLAALPDAERLVAQQGKGRREVEGQAGSTEGPRSQRQRLRPEPRPALCDPRHPIHGRVAGRLDGLPAGLGGLVLRGYGNAVPPVMGEYIGRTLIESLEGLA